MAGVPYWTHDIGGFFRDSNSMNPIFKDQYTNPEFIELMARWFQFGTFSPIFRIHGYVSEAEIWRYLITTNWFVPQLPGRTCEQ